MRAARRLIALVLWMTAGCGRVERDPATPPVSAREVVPTTDSVVAHVLVTSDTMRVTTDSTGVVTVVAETDTSQASAEPWAEPSDCRYADARPRVRRDDPRYGQRYDSAAIARGVTYRCRLRPGGPEARLVVLGEWSIPMAVKVFSPADEDSALQMLTLDNDQGAYEGYELLVGEDLNGDGWMDLRVHTFSGSGGQVSDVFRFDPSSRRFVADTVLPGGNVHRIAGRPCASSSWKTSAWDSTYQEWCWSGGRWLLTRDYVQEGVRNGRVVRTLRERRGGRMQLVRHDTVPDGTPHW
ncbi:MAG TPA: hypothetical protein VF006_31635 [Longimicrobium sp.]